MPDRVTVLPVYHAGRSFFFCFVGIAQTPEGLLADDVLHPAGVPFCCFRGYAGLGEQIREKAVLLIGLLGYLSPQVSQMKKEIIIHCKEPALLQSGHGTAHAWL